MSEFVSVYLLGILMRIRSDQQNPGIPQAGRMRRCVPTLPALLPVASPHHNPYSWNIYQFAEVQREWAIVDPGARVMSGVRLTEWAGRSPGMGDEKRIKGWMDRGGNYPREIYRRPSSWHRSELLCR